ncbi:hypothetical protein NDU88_002576 [Pleurodeles waltl]|uniref:Uncharacterized protein n=1 Tax=Pleurodeles waltl TaxID=8319 RepID=A0AAV7QC51_PLEWA|nr:hypothetical protein NDU88_002576 [Pleurodeles waltl]
MLVTVGCFFSPPEFLGLDLAVPDQAPNQSGSEGRERHRISGCIFSPPEFLGLELAVPDQAPDRSASGGRDKKRISGNWFYIMQ